MARTPSSLAKGSLATTTLTELYEVPTSNVLTPFLELTNTTSTKLDVDVYIEAGGTDLLFKTVTLPAGAGKSVLVADLSLQRLEAGEAIKIQLSSANAINYFLSGSLTT